MHEMKRILVIAPAWIGDMIMAHTFFQLLKRENPQSIIDVVAPAATLPLTKRMPEISTAFDLRIGHKKLSLGTRYRLGKLLRKNHYEQAIILPNSIKSALLPLFAKIPLRSGFLGEHRYFLLNDIRDLDKSLKMFQRYASLAFKAHSALPSELPHPRFSIDKKHQQQTLQQLQLKLDKPILVLCPGAEYGRAKRWGLEYFAKLAVHYTQQGWQVWILGGPNDVTPAHTIQQFSQHQCINLVGKTKLLDAIDLLSLAKVAVTNDSGLMHMAAALDIPLVALYGSSSPEHTPPLSKKAKILWLHLFCSPCFKRECPLSGNDHMRCLIDITPVMVQSAISELLEKVG
jgi:heptosyltransferase-2